MLTRFLSLIMALLCAGAAQAGDLPAVYEGRFPNGAAILLNAAAGPCVNGARQATWVSADATERILGCFKISPDGDVVGIAWMDGEGSAIALTYFKKSAGI